MKKERGVVKWFSRLKAYGYINPDDGDDFRPDPHSPIDGSSRRKTGQKQAAVVKVANRK